LGSALPDADMSATAAKAAVTTDSFSVVTAAPRKLRARGKKRGKQPQPALYTGVSVTCQERVLTSARGGRTVLNGAVPVTHRRAIVGPGKRDTTGLRATTI
jgi:hypothetical protein